MSEREALVEQLAEAIESVLHGNRREQEAAARAVLPLVEAHTAAQVEAAVSVVRAERDEVAQDRDEWKQATIAANRRFEVAEERNLTLAGFVRDWHGRAESAEADLRALREKVARVEALATKFENWPSSPSLSVAAKHIRAALSDPTTSDQKHCGKSVHSFTIGGSAPCARPSGHDGTCSIGGLIVHETSLPTTPDQTGGE